MAGDKTAKETKKAAGGDAPKTKGKRKDEGKGEVERPKKAPKAEKAAAAPKSKAEGARGKKAVEGGKAKKEKKAKDPNAPKKNLTAFMYFSNANREKVKAENPGASFGELGKLLGERWKSMSADDKAEFEEMAKKDKERYAKAMEEYKEGKGEGAAPPAAKKETAKKKEAPKKEVEEDEEGDDEEDEGGSDGGDEEDEEGDDE